MNNLFFTSSTTHSIHLIYPRQNSWQLTILCKWQVQDRIVPGRMKQVPFDNILAHNRYSPFASCKMKVTHSTIWFIDANKTRHFLLTTDHHYLRHSYLSETINGKFEGERKKIYRVRIF